MASKSRASLFARLAEHLLLGSLQMASKWGEVKGTMLRAIMPFDTAFVRTATALQLVSSMTLMSATSLS